MRIALVPIYVRYYESVVPGIREKKTYLLESVADFLREKYLTVEFPIVTDLISAQEANERLLRENFDCTVVLPLVAVFAQLGSQLVRGWKGPLLMLSVIGAAHSADSLTMSLVVAESQSFGAQAITNAWMREAKPFTAFSLDIENTSDRDHVQRWLRVHECVSRLNRLRIGLIGQPFPAMTDVELPGEFFHRIGASLVSLPMSRMHSLMREVDESAILQLEANLRRQFAWSSCSAAEREFSLRCAIVLPRLMEQESLDCAAFNSHGPVGLENKEFGIMPALGVTLATSAGRPLAEVGDLCTAFALWIGRQLGGACYYTELDSAYLSGDTWLLLNSGEFDLAWTRQGVQPSLIPNTNFSGVNGRGLSVCAALQEGPATIVNFTPTPDTNRPFRVLFCEGFIAPEWHPEMGVPNAHFQVRGNARNVYHRWLNAGPVHHSATIPGHIGLDLSLFCSTLGWEAVAVNA